MSHITIEYRFRLDNKQEDTYKLLIDAKSLQALSPVPEDPPGWTLLTFHQCGNCPLHSDIEQHCPAAVNMINIVKRFNNLLSYGKTLVIVVTKERMIYNHTTIQRGICSLLGLLMASSRCPLTDFFKPMARFHLPFASTEETIWRATSTYLLSQYFKKIDGYKPDITLEGLSDIYQKIQKVNKAFSGRLRAACEHDGMVNAIILLDLFAKSMPWAIEESLDEIRHLFMPYLNHPNFY
ncbi:MAG: hypothetical protein GY874_02460 [Desulfobacteraceae bacterium]|nr:hypothetical protein [Desulfobacteraceae bacterium]